MIAKRDSYVATEVQKKADRPLHFLFSNRLSPDDYDKFHELFHTLCVSRPEVEQSLKAFMESPQPPVDAVMRELEKFPFTPSKAIRKTDAPKWLKQLCAHRDDFVNTVLLICDEDGVMEDAFLMLVAMQKPVSAWFARLSAASWFLDRLDDWRPENGEYDDAGEWNHAFFVRESHIVKDDEIANSLRGKELCVVPSFFWNGAWRIVSASPRETFAWFARDMHVAAQAKARAQPGPRVPRGYEPEPWEEAWLSKKIEGPVATSHAVHPQAEQEEAAVAAETKPAPAVDGDEEGDEAREDAVAFVDSVVDGGAHPNFFVSVLGRAWTQAHRSMAWDALTGKARGGLPTQFLVHYGLQKSIRFARRLHGIEKCLVLAQAWCHRMEHFFLWWCEEGEWGEPIPPYVQDGADTVEFIDWALACGPDSPEWARVVQIRNLTPTEAVEDG